MSQKKATYYSTDALTSFLTLDGAEGFMMDNIYWEKPKKTLALIYFASLKEMIMGYGSAFAIEFLESQSIRVRNFFKIRNLDVVLCRVAKDTFSIFMSDVAPGDCKTLCQSLHDELMAVYHGRGEESTPRIEFGIYAMPKAFSDFRLALHRAGAAVESVAASNRDIGVYYEGIENEISYVPAKDRAQRLDEEDFSDYDSGFVAEAVKMLADSRDLDANTDLLLQRIGTEFHFDSVLIGEFTNGHFVSVTNLWDAENGICVPDEIPTNIELWDGFFTGFDRQGIHIVKDVNKTYFSERDRKVIASNNIRSFINVLLTDRDAPIGYLSCANFTPMARIGKRLVSTLAHLSHAISSFVTLRAQRNNHKNHINSLSIDQLTGLYTYAFFQRKTLQSLHNLDRMAVSAIVSADIRNFSHLNEIFGYAEGDRVLRLFSRMLKDSTSKKNICCHMEADRFLFYLEDASEDKIMESIKKLTDEFGKYLKKHYCMNDLQIITGVYFIKNPNKELIHMIDAANHARKSIKNSYSENIAVYSDELRAKRKNILEVVGTVHDAIELGFIEAFLQPKFSMSRRTITGAEALVRWRNQDGSYRFPNQFIPILENAGLIVDVDMCVFRQILEALARWKKDGRKQLPISVNFSRLHFRSPNFYENVQKLADEYGVDPSLVEIEVTESTLCENQESLFVQLHQLRKIGFHVDIDDFGTGYSSLNMLMGAPVDIVKVDKSFIDHYESKKEQNYIDQIGNLILSADKDIIFEGVETEEQIEFLTHHGYDRAQGYIFSKPIPLREFEEKYIYNE